MFKINKVYYCYKQSTKFIIFLIQLPLIQFTNGLTKCIQKQTHTYYTMYLLKYFFIFQN